MADYGSNSLEAHLDPKINEHRLFCKKSVAIISRLVSNIHTRVVVSVGQ